MALSNDDKDELLRHFEQEAAEDEPETITVPLDDAWPDFILDDNLVERTGQSATIDVQLQPFFRHLKELTLTGYYTSEIGATEELQYEHTPGRYDACVPLEEVGRTWA